MRTKGGCDRLRSFVTSALGSQSDGRRLFICVLNNLRGDPLTQYLAYHGLSISQIAWLLGYQEVSAFTKRFRNSDSRGKRYLFLSPGAF
jgi:hypothetical protein